MNGHRPHPGGGGAPAVSLRGVTLKRGHTTLVSDLDLDVAPGEFLAILGPNGSGKSSVLDALLGNLTPAAGTITIGGRPPGARHSRIGYIPQQRSFDHGLTLRGRDLVRLGVDGTDWGPGIPGRGRARRRTVDEALDALDAGSLAEVPLARMSGGQQQRVRAAQALASDPCVLLCDEPLLSLDLPGQRTIARVLDRRRREHRTGILFVTHEINPVLPLVDRVLYLVDGRHRTGPPGDVLTTKVLSELFDSPVEVATVGGQLVVVGDTQHLCADPHVEEHHHHGHGEEGR